MASSPTLFDHFEDQDTSSGRYVSAPEAAKALGCGARQIGSLALHGALKMRVDPNFKSLRLQAFLETDITLEKIYQNWIVGVTRWDFEASYRHKRIRAAAKIPFEYPQPDGLDDFVREVLGPSGFPVYEMPAFYTSGAKTRVYHRHRLLDTEVKRLASGEGGEVTPALVLHRFPKLGGIPHTIFDSNADEAIEPNQSDLVDAFKLSALAEVACALLLLTASSGRHQVRPMVRAFQAIDARPDSEAKSVTSEALVQACHSILDDAPADTAGKNRAALNVRHFLLGSRFLKIAAGRDPKPFARFKFLHAIPIKDNVALRYRIAKLVDDFGNTYKKRRRQRVDCLMSLMTRLDEAVRFRAEQVVACEQTITRHASRAKNYFRKHDEHSSLPAHYDIECETTVIDDDGALRAGQSQFLKFRLWRAKDLWADLGDEVQADRDFWNLGAEGLDAIRNMSGNANDHKSILKRNLDCDDVMVEFIGIDARMGETRTPWFIRLCEDAVNFSPTQLSPEGQRRRRQTMSEFQISEMPAISNRLFGFSSETKGLAAAMLKRGRTLVPIEALATGARFAELMYRGIEQSLCRIGEMLQMEQHPDAWARVPSAVGTAPAFYAIPKRHSKRQPMEVTEEFFAEALALARRSAILSGHFEGFLPYVDPCPAVGVRFVEPRPFLFQFENSAISHIEITYLMNLLSLGVAKVSPHLLRHVHARRMRERGVPKSIRMMKLNQSSPTVEDHYSRGSARRKMAELSRQTEQAKSVSRSAVRRRKVSGGARV